MIYSPACHPVPFLWKFASGDNLATAMFDDQIVIVESGAVKPICFTRPMQPHFLLPEEDVLRFLSLRKLTRGFENGASVTEGSSGCATAHACAGRGGRGASFR